MLPVIIYDLERFYSNNTRIRAMAPMRLSALWVLDGDTMVPGENAPATRERTMELAETMRGHLDTMDGSRYKKTRMVPWVTPDGDGFRLRALLVLLPNSLDIASDREALAEQDAAKMLQWQNLTDAPGFCYSQAGDDDWDINAICQACRDYSDPADASCAFAPVPPGHEVALSKLEARLLQVVLERQTDGAPIPPPLRSLPRL